MNEIYWTNISHSLSTYKCLYCYKPLTEYQTDYLYCRSCKRLYNKLDFESNML